MSTITSYKSDSVSDHDNESTANNDDTHDLSFELNGSQQQLPPPDLVASIKPTNLNESYSQHLQQMADLSKQQLYHEQSSSSTIPFFGKDDPVMDTERDPLPTTNLERSVLFDS